MVEVNHEPSHTMSLGAIYEIFNVYKNPSSASRATNASLYPYYPRGLPKYTSQCVVGSCDARKCAYFRKIRYATKIAPNTTATPPTSIGPILVLDLFFLVGLAYWGAMATVKMCE